MNPATTMKDGATWDVLKYMAGAEANKIRAQAGWALPALPGVVADLKIGGRSVGEDLVCC